MVHFDSFWFPFSPQWTFQIKKSNNKSIISMRKKDCVVLCPVMV